MKYLIPKRSIKCSIKEELFLPGMELISALYPAKQGYLRKDFCLECWLICNKDELEKGGVSYWKVLLPLKKKVEKDFSLSQVFDLFCLLVNKEEEKELLFVLALYLERKHILSKREEKQSVDKTLLFYEYEETGEVFIIQKMPADSLNLDHLQKKLTVH
ncbi:MAG: hypothetical protein P4L16_06645 [Chlamydiales bacterium]|nr:hypothetical protein [Chlamydiales bacterium]